jgi:cytochrome bd-type quinol oxidase subunit 2
MGNLWAVLALEPTVALKPKQGIGFKTENLTSLKMGDIVSGLISFALIVAAVVFFFMLVWGGLKWIMSQGDENKVKEARAQVTQALIGLAVVFAAWAILSLVAHLFGLSGLQNLTIPSFQSQ